MGAPGAKSHTHENIVSKRSLPIDTPYFHQKSPPCVARQRSPATNLTGLAGWLIFLQTSYQILPLAASI
ncbi:hypothetical protein [Neochlamydia sp. S13]|uniref:hypothetical protein n=1 Tax=Neochlamydia sp. S13 TaxID=1353976 RepID=UPI0005A78252|nr:hypothetical protein [Neochlamydia sp. S13]